MKKQLFLIALGLLLLLSACGSASIPAPVRTATASPVITASPAPADLPLSAASEPSLPVPTISAGIDPTDLSPADVPDVDLTLLSPTMVYSQVYAMITAPEQYIGQTVKMTGGFSVYEAGDIRYCACIVADATACCAQGLEFELNENYVYPEDYPEPGSEITVLGVFDSYTEEYGGNTYIYLVLRNAELL